MSTEYSSVLGTGFVFPMEEVLDLFRKVTPGKTHMEDRYDQKTGEKLDPVKVVDEGDDETFVWPGDPKSETDDAWEFVEFLAGKLQCGHLIFGHLTADSGFVLFSAKVEEDNDSGIEDVDAGHVDFAGNLSYESIVEARIELKALELRMANYGLKPKKAVVQNCWTIS